MLDENEALRRRIAELEAKLAATTVNDPGEVVVAPMQSDATADGLYAASLASHMVAYSMGKLTAKVGAASRCYGCVAHAQ